MKDELGNRIKNNYENRTKHLLPRRTYSIIRLDGKAFHTFTKGLDIPYDEDLMSAMDYVAFNLIREIQGAQFAYVQSDEISVLLTDFENPKTEAWFNGNIQKMVSVSASIATGFFNARISSLIKDDGYDKFLNKKGEQKIAFFDSRVFTIPDRTEVENYFIWRQKDATRNSVSMYARGHNISHKNLTGKSTVQVKEMIKALGADWNLADAGFKYGRLIYQEIRVPRQSDEGIERTEKKISSFDFVEHRYMLSNLIPRIL